MKRWITYVAQFLFLLILLGVLFSYAMFQGDFVSWFLFFAFLPIVLYLSGLFIYPVSGWQIERKLSRNTFQAGAKANVKLILRRRLPFPLAYCIVEEIFPASLNKADIGQQKYKHMERPGECDIQRKMKKAVFPYFSRVIEIVYTLDHIPRGHHELRSVKVRTGDLFGFLEKEYVYSISEFLTVLPNVRELRIGKQFSNDAPGAAPAHQTYMKNTNIVSSVRAYVPGDKFSAIDWKQTARTNALMTKEFEQEKNQETLLVLDSSFSEEKNKLAFEAAVEMTASLLEMTRRQGTESGLLVIGEGSSYFPRTDHFKEAQTIFHHLAAIEPLDKIPFAVSLQKEVMQIENGQAVVIMTNQLDEALNETLRQMKLSFSHISVFFIKATNLISGQDKQYINKLRQEGTDVAVLTEKQLVESPIEVKV